MLMSPPLLSVLHFLSCLQSQGQERVEEGGWRRAGEQRTHKVAKGPATTLHIFKKMYLIIHNSCLLDMECSCLFFSGLTHCLTIHQFQYSNLLVKPILPMPKKFKHQINVLFIKPTIGTLSYQFLILPHCQTPKAHLFSNLSSISTLTWLRVKGRPAHQVQQPM